MPNRILKESICASENIDQLTAFQETFFYRLMVNCDDYGRMDARVKILAARLFPLREIRTNQVEDALRALTSAELVILYEVDGKPFLQMKTWDKHQQVRAKKSKYPSPNDGNCNQMISNDNKCLRNPIQSESNPNPNPKENRRFTPPSLDEVTEYCRERNNGIDPQHFIDFYESKGWKVGNQAMKDWRACIRTWEQRDRGKAKVIPAADFQQRDYSGVQAEMMDDLANEMKLFQANGA